MPVGVSPEPTLSASYPAGEVTCRTESLACSASLLGPDPAGQQQEAIPGTTGQAYRRNPQWRLAPSQNLGEMKRLLLSATVAWGGESQSCSQKHGGYAVDMQVSGQRFSNFNMRMGCLRILSNADLVQKPGGHQSAFLTHAQCCYRRWPQPHSRQWPPPHTSCYLSTPHPHWGTTDKF